VPLELHLLALVRRALVLRLPAWVRRVLVRMLRLLVLVRRARVLRLRVWVQELRPVLGLLAWGRLD
jgi:hypothetical protein